MTAFFSGTWAGMGTIEDLDRGVIERFLATPARRSAIVCARVLQSAVVATIQAVIILVVGLFLGATNGGPLGWLVIMLAAFLVAGGFSGISNGIALRTRQEATMIAVANFIGLPLLFFSSILIAASLIPDWMRDALAREPGRVGRAGLARPGAAGHRLGQDRALPAAARLLHGADRRVRDPLLPRRTSGRCRRRPTRTGSAHRSCSTRARGAADTDGASRRPCRIQLARSGVPRATDPPGRPAPDGSPSDRLTSPRTSRRSAMPSLPSRAHGDLGGLHGRRVDRPAAVEVERDPARPRAAPPPRPPARRGIRPSWTPYGSTSTFGAKR